MPEPALALSELHIARAARDRYGLDQRLFATDGRTVIADPQIAREIADRISRARHAAGDPVATNASDLYAMALIHEALHLLIARYRTSTGESVMPALPSHLERRLGRDRLDATLHRFLEEFPPAPVYRGELTIDEYLAGRSEGVSNRERALEEMLVLWLANDNPAFRPYRHLFDDRQLQVTTAYLPVVAGMYQFFCLEPGFEGDGEQLMELLLGIARSDPDSLEGQLRFLMRRFGAWIGDAIHKLLGGLDMLREEHAPRFGGPGPAPVLDFADLAEEPENFSTDLDWMPNVVLMAKNAHVWLYQLSIRHGRTIARLDEIPEVELQRLARWGVTGLWLIGLWQRSPASERIKRMCGNPEAVASAYSLHDYQIADDLGGEPALDRLRQLAWQHGIRLASDLVPNHMGIDSRWVLEHPDWFVQRDTCPFPSYTFDGTDLSPRSEIGIYLEDHYYSRTDAAVVFKLVERTSGRERFIYHGNDGTSMPWNDTAQLNYLRDDVREAMIQTILAVARRFPIIRFDAAMTLAKKHYQRLWFPEPGTGGAIPSRSDHPLTRAEFDAQMPEEFWREVVDRVAAEAPDTLLLAEAFWLMEGYFVRSLGMHRVYNSAFMNMLRDEDNEKYHSVIRNILEFEPEILKRFVNFMNNPDEDTAVAQFGRDDKYFGVCTLMVTLPGLPMVGHGQVEGLAEKYGMEYRRPYWDEHPDHGMIARHEREIFPLIRRRTTFSEVQQFVVYEARTAEGHVNHDVFAYSNGRQDDRALVLYHNRYADTEVTIHHSIPLERAAGQRRELVDALGLSRDSTAWCVWRDHRTGREHLLRSDALAERGLTVRLGPYQAQVYLDIRQHHDTTGVWAEAARQLPPEGARDVERLVRAIVHSEHVELLEQILEPQRLRRLASSITRQQPATTNPDDCDLASIETEIASLYAALSATTTVIESGGSEAPREATGAARPAAGTTDTSMADATPAPGPSTATAERTGEPEDSSAAAGDTAVEPGDTASTVLEDDSETVGDAISQSSHDHAARATATLARALALTIEDAKDPAPGVLAAWSVLRHLPDTTPAERRGLVDEHALEIAVERTLRRAGHGSDAAEWAAELLRALVAVDATPSMEELATTVLGRLQTDAAWQHACGVNAFEGVRWIDREKMVDALRWLDDARRAEHATGSARRPHTQTEPARSTEDRAATAQPTSIVERILEAGDRCLWRLDRIRGALEDGSFEPGS